MNPDLITRVGHCVHLTGITELRPEVYAVNHDEIFNEKLEDRNTRIVRTVRTTLIKIYYKSIQYEQLEQQLIQDNWRTSESNYCYLVE